MTHPSSSGAVPAIDRVCLLDPLDVLAWRIELKCTERELRAAVYAVGSEPVRVRRYFRRSLLEKIFLTLRRLAPKARP
jgi:hypothetical protein